VAKFQDWSGLKICIKKTIVTGALYGQDASRRQGLARKTERQQARTGNKRSRCVNNKETQEGEYEFDNEHEAQDPGSDVEVDPEVLYCLQHIQIT